MAEFHFLVGEFNRVKTGSGVHPASFLIGTGGFSFGVKRPEREDNSPLYGAAVKNDGAIPSLAHMSLWLGD
jgi:hypothetical protein